MVSSQPLLTLKFLGAICPCFEKEEDGPARKAAWSLAAVRIRWHKKTSLSCVDDSGGLRATGGVAGFFSGMFSSAVSSPTESYEVIEATLSIMDSSRGPSLIVSDSSTDSKKVPLKYIKTIERQSGLMNSPTGSSGIEVLAKSGEELLRFDLLRPTESDQMEEADESMCDELIDQLLILVDWERRRQDHLLTSGEETTEEDYNESGSPRGNAITDKARKVHHFAAREIEMQKTKREREARKAKYVKDAGGLKYTAIAMANRSYQK